jgi:hypothetical protein
MRIPFAPILQGNGFTGKSLWRFRRLEGLGPQAGAVPDSQNFDGSRCDPIHKNVRRSGNHCLARPLCSANTPGVGHPAYASLRFENSSADGNGPSGALALKVFDYLLEMFYRGGGPENLHLPLLSQSSTIRSTSSSVKNRPLRISSSPSSTMAAKRCCSLR